MLAAILAVGFALRAIQTHLGLPYLYNFDDPQVAAHALNILKTGDIFTATGRFTLEKDDVCSKCGQDLQLPIDHKFTEFLMNENNADQKGHAPHSGLNLENDQEVTFVQGYELDLGEFIREQLAVAIPAYPVCADTQACETRPKPARSTGGSKRRSRPAEGRRSPKILFKPMSSSVTALSPREDRGSRPNASSRARVIPSFIRPRTNGSDSPTFWGAGI